MKSLTQRVAEYYDACRDANSSWREFTNDLSCLNLLGFLEETNYEFVVELLQDTEEFENEDGDDLLAAVGQYLEPLKTVPEWVTAANLTGVLEETGLDASEVASSAREAGVSEAEVAAFLSEAAKESQVSEPARELA